MSFEMKLIGKLLKERNITVVRKRKLTADFFYDERARILFNFISNHHLQHGEVPSFELVQHEYPELVKTLPRSKDSLSALCEKLTDKKLQNDLKKALLEIKDLLKEKHSVREALGVFKEKAMKLSVIHNADTDLDVTQCKEAMLNEYRFYKEAGGMLGIPYPWPTLNKITQGLLPGQLVVIYASPKKMKTWLALKIGMHCHANKRRVVFASKEMSPELLRKRLVALYAGLIYKTFKDGLLTGQEEKDFCDTLDALSETKGLFVSQIRGMGLQAVHDFEAKLTEYDAEVGFFDGVYLCSPTRDWKEIAQITTHLKSLAQQKNIPIIITTQQNRYSANGGTRSGKDENEDDGKDLAFSASFQQDADLLMKIYYGEQEKENNELRIVLPSVRESEGTSFVINARVANDFSEKWMGPPSLETLKKEEAYE